MDEEKPIILTAQGSFSAGGKTLKAEGTYDPSHALDPAGQTKHVDHAYVFIRRRRMRGRTLSCSSMEPGRAEPHGRRRLTGAKDSRRYSSVRDTRYS